MPKISVIIPIYNGEKCISDCIAKLSKQTLQDIEIICVDDGSTDKTAEIIDKLSAQHKNILSFHKENGGAGSARNVGLDNATGEYVIFLDSDDEYTDIQVLERLYTLAKANKAEICGSICGLIDRKPRLYKNTYMQGFVEYKDFQYDTGFQNFLFNRTLIEQEHIRFPEYRVYEDPVFMARAFSAAERFYAIIDPIYVYSGVHQDNLDVNKTIHLLKGIRDNLLLSSHYQYERLHFDLYKKLDTLASCYFEINLSSENYELFKALIDTYSAIDKDLLNNTDTSIEEVDISGLRTVWNMAIKYNKLRRLVPFKIEKIRRVLWKHN